MSAITERKKAVFARASIGTLIQSAFTMEAIESPSQEERMVRAWIFDEIERRVGQITLDEEHEFERVYDETNSYLAALIHIRPQLADYPR
ncbi:hypothetical protein PBI_PINTO_83 [Mycobacterium phage Pinto]|uniref:hypothetical protein n=1 Tax=Mycobacterium phage Pinto TaxID=1498204 RepID=UPI00045F7211|nr:hypothetical protein PBI_PINTO_83 [Mycobacterium phage Pinto]AHZ95163.1 hypothetical protein PBI_PINTO_83 [Mycobacterium phage Pinto]